jgi:hypothetical protein
MNKQHKGPKVLILDIETLPILARVWGLRDQNIAPNQVLRDGFIVAWAAKWYEDKYGRVYGPHNKLVYLDQRKLKIPIKNERFLMKPLWDMIDEADIILGQNSNAFDIKKINTGFFDTGLPKPSDFNKTDVYLVNKKHFSHSSNKLEFITKKYCTKYKKLNHGKYPGQELWNAIEVGDQAAWREMEVYNKHDVLATEEYYSLIQGWDDSINANYFTGVEKIVCIQCGADDFKKQGFFHSASGGKFQRFRCLKCGRPTRSKLSQQGKVKRAMLKKGPV